MPRRLAAIMFTDIAGFTQLAQVDEPGALRLLQEQEKLVRPLLPVHQGRRVKSTGDGLLLEFEDALVSRIDPPHLAPRGESMRFAPGSWNAARRPADPDR